MATTWQVRLGGVVVAALYCASLVLPAFEAPSNGWGTMSGWEALVAVPEYLGQTLSTLRFSEWKHIFSRGGWLLLLYWGPNPVMFVGLSCFLCRRFLLASIAGLIGGGIALWIGFVWWYVCEHPEVDWVAFSVCSGYYVWLSSFFALVALSVAMMLRLRRNRVPSVHSS